MRPPPKRAGGRQSRGPALTSVLPASDGSRRAVPSTGVPPDERLDSPPGSANGPGHGKVETGAGAAVEGESTPSPESDRHRLSSQAAVPPAAPEASAADELQRQDRHLSSEDCVFRVGDTVLARTAGRPAREATVVEADPSDGSRFKVAFKDKRKKGGWRDKSELSSLPRPADAGSAATAKVPLASSSAAAAHEARPAPPQHQGDDRNAEVDATAAAAAAAAAAAPGPSLAADSEATSSKQQPPCSEVVAAESSGALAAVVNNEAQRQGHDLPSMGCLFQVGDAVLASTAGKAAVSSSEATVVEVDPSGGSRFKVAFKDKRKKGGWRDKSELSTVRYTGAGSTPAGQPPSEPASGDACGTGGGGGGTVGADPAAGLPRPGASDTSSAPECPSTAVEAEPMPQSDRRRSTAAVVGAHESSEASAPVPAPASPPGPLFGVGEAVLVSTAGKTAATASFEATVVEVDPSDSSRFRVAFKNKRKQGGWRHRSELSALIRRTGARSTATRPASGSVGNAGATSGSSARHERSRAGVLGQGGRASGAPALDAASEARAGAKRPPGQCLQRSASEGERPVDKVGSRKATASVMDATAVGEGGAVSRPPKRKRSAATAAAAAITATAGNRGRGGSGSSGGGGVEAINKKPVKKGGHAKRGSVPTAGGAAAGITKKTPRKKGWQRPTVVTPGSAEGRPESALRTTHPTGIIRPRKQFKVQQARETPKNRTGSSDPTSRGATTPRSSFSAGRGGSAPRRMLCQPSHSVRDAKRGGFEGGDGGDRSSGVGGGAGADDESDVVRRGRRARRQVHPSLSEDTMAAANGGIESDYGSGAEGSGEDREGAGAGAGYGDAPFRFRTSEFAPWGEGDRPLIKVETALMEAKVRLSLLEGDAPLSAERSALAVVTFVFDRHRYSAEQLANVLTAEGFLCYREEGTRVFVLTESKEANQKEALMRVRELALSRCGVEVKATPWLKGRPALNEFLDNHRGVLDLIIRHRLACGMWSEVGGVYFNALFCGRRSKRTFNGVRLQINLAVSHNRALETGVWELWMTVEPVVHRFSPVDWWALMQEKEDKGLADFSGSKSDELEERLQVVCLPKLTRGVVDDVKEDAFEMDLLQEANLKRGYYVGPRSEDEMEFDSRDVLVAPDAFLFPVLTYPSWCVIRGQKEIPEATKAMRGRILDSFTDALDGNSEVVLSASTALWSSFLPSVVSGMQGVHVMETTFTWQVQGEGEGRTFGDAQAFATANGTAVAVQKTGASAPAVTPGPASGDGDGSAAAHGDGDDGSVGGGSGRATQAAAELRTPGPSAAGVDGAAADSSGLDNDQRGGSAPVVVTPPADPNASTPPPPLLVCRLGEQQQQSPESRAAAAAAQASVAAVRKSVVRRRGAVVPNRVPSRPTGAAGAAGGAGAAGESSSTPRLCSIPFVIKRNTASPSSAVATGKVSGNKSGPLDLSGGDQAAAMARQTEGRDSVDLGTPRADGSGDRSDTAAPTPAAARVVTPAPAFSEGAGRKKKRKDKSSRREGGAASVDKERRKKRKKGAGMSAAPAPAPAAVGAGERLGAGEELRGASPAGGTPAAAPPPMVVTFAAAGSLGMGLEADTTEEGTMRLAGKAPTSAAAAVPNGWRLTAVGGKSVRRLGGGCADGNEIVRAAPTKSKAAAAGAKPKAGTKAKAPAGRSKGKKASKVTTVRKAFKIQARASPQQERQGGETGGGGGGHAVPVAVQASSTSAAI
ncbi:unnamed protein product [Ectocarpus sp. CCAP 1310/34]|nr:unnamed protein product [Ectocarpus sp. CCAP 1310/34]